jgi:hypothetical protein
MRREVLAGLALGAILGSIGFLRITLWSASSTVLRATLAARRRDRCRVARRRRAVGNTEWIVAAVSAQAVGIESAASSAPLSRRSWTSPAW